MTQTLSTYVVALVSLIVLDAVWIGVVAWGFYTREIGYLMPSSPSLLPAALFYLVYAFAITALVVIPHSHDSLFTVFCYGAILGLAAYGAYDLTNQALIKDWPVVMTVVDLAWGVFASATASTVTAYIIRTFVGV